MKLPVACYLDVFRSAPPGRRIEAVRKLQGALALPLPEAASESFDIGEFRSFKGFKIKYRTLATALGHAGKIPPPGELDFLHAMVDLDDVRYPGGIGSRDYFFVTALVSILAPRRVIEIGTLTGFSAAIIAAAVHRQHGADEIGVIPSEVEGPRGNSSTPDSGRLAITVETIDAHTHCSIDETRPIGFEIPELIPDLVSAVRVHTQRESDFARELGGRDEFGLAFINADHRHPWPLLDVLRLAPLVPSGGWILLHDIQLGTHGEELREGGRSQEGGTPYGAEWLFDRWPFRKIRSFHIGAIEIPSDKAALIPFALDLMNQPFELTGKAAKRIRRALGQSFADLT